MVSSQNSKETNKFFNIDKNEESEITSEDLSNSEREMEPNVGHIKHRHSYKI